MKCEKCGKSADCRTAKVYYSAIVSEKSTTENKYLSTKTTTTTTYTMPKEAVVPICMDCLIKKKRRNLLLTPLYTLLLIGIIGQIAPENLVFQYILVAVWGLTIVLVIIALIQKKYKTQISDGEVFMMARTQLKKKLKKTSRKTEYEFWSSYPTNLKIIK